MRRLTMVLSCQLLLACDAGPPPAPPERPRCQTRRWSQEIVDDRRAQATGVTLGLRDGQPVLAYPRPTAFLNDFTFASRATGGDWQHLDLTSSSTHEGHGDLVVAPGGDVHLVFQDIYDGFLRHATISRDGSVAIDDVVDPQRRIGGSAAVALQEDGTPVAVHVDTYASLGSVFEIDAVDLLDPARTQVVDQRPAQDWQLEGPLDLAAGWVADVYVDSRATTLYELSISPVAAFTDGRQVVVPASSSWIMSSPRILPRQDGTPGVVFCAARPDDPEAGGIQRATPDGQGGWTIERMAPGGPCHLSLAVDARGQVLVAAAFADGRLVTLAGPAWGAWQAGELAPEGLVNWPEVALAADGTAYVAYLGRAGSDGPPQVTLATGTCEDAGR